MDVVITWLIARLKEPSTWAGTGLIASAVHNYIPGSMGDNIISTLQGLGGILAVLLEEKSKKVAPK